MVRICAKAGCCRCRQLVPPPSPPPPPPPLRPQADPYVVSRLALLNEPDKSLQSQRGLLLAFLHALLRLKKARPGLLVRALPSQGMRALGSVSMLLRLCMCGVCGGDTTLPAAQGPWGSTALTTPCSWLARAQIDPARGGLEKAAADLGMPPALLEALLTEFYHSRWARLGWA